MDELNNKKQIVNACDFLNIKLNEKKMKKTNFLSSYSSLDEIASSAMEAANKSLYVLSNSDRKSGDYKNAEKTLGKIIDVWSDGANGINEGNNQSKILDSIRKLNSDISIVKDRIEGSKSNVISICKDYVSQTIKAMEYLNNLYEREPEKYIEYKYLAGFITKFKEAESNLNQTIVSNSESAYAFATDIQEKVKSVRVDLTTFTNKINDVRVDEIVDITRKWSSIEIGKEQASKKAKSFEKADSDDIDELINFIPTEYEIVAFIERANDKYNYYLSEKDKIDERKQVIVDKKNEVKELFQNGRITKEEAQKQILDLMNTEKKIDQELLAFKTSGVLTENLHMFAEKISNLYYITMKDFSYKDKASCFVDSDEYGINLTKCLRVFSPGSNADSNTLLNAFDTLKVVLDKANVKAIEISETLTRMNKEEQSLNKLFNDKLNDINKINIEQEKEDLSAIDDFLGIKDEKEPLEQEKEEEVQNKDKINKLFGNNN